MRLSKHITATSAVATDEAGGVPGEGFSFNPHLMLDVGVA